MLKICEKYVILSFLWFVHFSALTRADELPDESVLPEDSIESPSDLTLPVVQLPGEDQLPTPRGDEQINGDDVQAADAFQNRLIDPKLQGLGLDQSPDQQPWLRIQAGGPVAPIRSIAFTGDGKRLCAGGEDKALWIWNQQAANQPWQLQKTAYWPIQRAERGVVNTLAVTSENNLVAVAGNGAWASNGDIFLFNSATGDLQNVLFDDNIGHRQAIVSMAFSPENSNPTFVSVDGEGKIIAWKQGQADGLWKATLVRNTDEATFPNQPELSTLLRNWRGYNPIAMIDADTIIHTEFDRLNSLKYPIWKIVRTRISDRSSSELAGPNIRHVAMVTSMAISPDRSKLFTADAAKLSYMWNLANKNASKIRPDLPPALASAFGPNGRHLVVGTAGSANGKSQLELYDVNQPARPLSVKVTHQEVRSCDIHPDGQQLAFVQGNSIELVRVGNSLNSQATLNSATLRPDRVAISKEPPYQIAFTRIDQQGAEVSEKIVFDTEKLQLRTVENLNADEWSSGQTSSQGWEIRTESNAQAELGFWTYHDGQRKAKLPLDVRSQGQVVAASVCWLTNDQHQPFAVAVGLNGSNNIFVFRLQDQGVCPVIRQFRGHTAEVRSITASPDGRILVSSANDGTIRAWPLTDFDTLPNVINRWGATFQISNDQLVVDQIREDGPLYFRGVRQGDVVRIHYYQNQATHAVSAKESMAKLLDSDWNQMVQFEYIRGDAPARSFLLFPAWQQLATLFVDQNRQWAFWSPAGYYDASLEGNNLFGWQVNRGRSESPDSFLAARFREALEQPRVMSQLLATGSLDAAFRRAGQDVPARTDQTIMDQYRLKPVIQILPFDKDPFETLQITAEISVPKGETLLPPKAFTNGVVATNAKLLESTETDGRVVSKYQWDANLPADQRILLQVVASTQSKIVDIQERLFEQKRQPNRRSPRMFVSTVGIDRYRDSQIQRLDFAVNNATQVAKVLESLSSPVYKPETSVALVNEQANRQTWKNAIQSQLQQLKSEVSPDDLIVIFLSGHGLRDAASGDYLYVGADARYEDLMSQRYGDCISFSDLSQFADIPCRKLVILDTCHAGAINLDQRRELQSALRMLQDDMIFTLTASQGNEEAVELREQKLGRFTHRLLESLHGAADTNDGDRNGVTSFKEVISYVKRTVRQDSQQDTYQQEPAAGPVALLKYADFPLTSLQASP